jgi:Asp-tRNA(Asn)/Glu-tRNA(Gln) amidotransferase A subunit family amidase
MTNQEAIKTIKIAIAEVEWNYPMDYAVAFEMAIEALKANQWVSVEERLPKDEKPVLAYYGFNKNGENFGLMFIGTLTYFVFDKKPHWQHESTGLFVTHWMPLPEPPAQKGD